MLPVPELRQLNPVPINLKMNNQQPKVLFETVGKLAGINVLFDPEFTTAGVSPKPLSIELNNATLDEALDYLSLVTKSFWKPLSSNAIFVTQDAIAKQLDQSGAVLVKLDSDLDLIARESVEKRVDALCVSSETSVSLRFRRFSRRPRLTPPASPRPSASRSSRAGWRTAPARAAARDGA